MPVTINGTTGIEPLIQNGNNISAVNSLGFRNRIINGDMRIDQRNAGAIVTLNGANDVYPVDRFGAYEFTDGTMTAQQSSVAPAGFTNSIVFTTTSADTSLSSTQRCTVFQRIEGNNIADFAFGTASAATVTLSFWVRSSLTGTFGASLVGASFGRSYPFNYTISAANTWEQKTVTIPGDISGTWLTTNGVGLVVVFNLGSGSNYLGTANAWAAGELYAPTGATSVIGTNGATFYITGVQLEAGTVATPFERRPYGEMLNLCYRYYQQFNYTELYHTILTPMRVATTSSIEGTFNYYEKRASPSFVSSSASTFRVNDGAGGDQIANSVSVVQLTTFACRITFGKATANLTINSSGYVNTEAATDAFLSFSSEL